MTRADPHHQLRAGALRSLDRHRWWFAHADGVEGFFSSVEGDARYIVAGPLHHLAEIEPGLSLERHTGPPTTAAAGAASPMRRNPRAVVRGQDVSVAIE